MPPLFTTIGPWTVQTFTLMLALGIALSAGFGLWRARRESGLQIPPVIDVYLAALVLGVIGARLFHVLINFDYFSDNLNEAFDLTAGGLDWHGAVIGGLIGLSILTLWYKRRGASVRSLPVGQTLPLPANKLTFRHLLDTAALALPLIGLGTWYGCLAAGCGYGLEVDTLANYPPLVASESVDVFGIVAPRYNTQVFGIILCIIALVILLLLIWGGRLRGRRFWFILALLSAGMFVIGFFRADHAPVTFGLRADQILDAVFLFESAWLFWNEGRRAKS